MKITMRYFARVAEVAGCDREVLELADGATAAEAMAAAAARHPALAAEGFRPLLAINRRHAAGDDILGGGDEVAVFPPVSGG